MTTKMTDQQIPAVMTKVRNISVSERVAASAHDAPRTMFGHNGLAVISTVSAGAWRTHPQI